MVDGWVLDWPWRCLALALLVARVFANDAHDALAPHDAARFTLPLD